MHSRQGERLPHINTEDLGVGPAAAHHRVVQLALQERSCGISRSPCPTCSAGMSAQNTAWPVVELSPARWATFPPSVEAGLAGLGAAAASSNWVD